MNKISSTYIKNKAKFSDRLEKIYIGTYKKIQFQVDKIKYVLHLICKKYCAEA